MTTSNQVSPPAAINPKASAHTRAQELVAWFRSQPRARLHEAVNVTADDDQGIGLVAGRAIAANDIIVAVPSSVLMSTALPHGQLPAGLPEALAKYCPDYAANPSVILALVLLLAAFAVENRLELANAATWKAYLAALPQDLASSPVFYARDVLDRLRHLPAFQLALDVYDALETAFYGPNKGAGILAALQATLPTTFLNHDPLHLFRKFEWAYAIVESRAFKPFPSQPDTVAMVPVGDLLNHTSLDGGANVGYRWRAGVGRPGVLTGTLELYATRAIPQGAPLLMRYNALSCSDELVFYGFCEQENPHDVFPVSLASVPRGMSDTVFESRVRALLTTGPVENARLEHVLTPDAGNVGDLLVSFRVLQATDAELAAWSTPEGRPEAWDMSPLVQGFSAENNQRAMAAIQAWIRDDLLERVRRVPSDALPNDASRAYVAGLARIVAVYAEAFGVE
ncbi:hypothetical protein AMAG_02309 [Allomyces macrogynus ATCC 38327]|uniref:Uncharacterized protein n=1 Tax=Allomyces macrogynus (strain ATCC 38327) TaxID=578462 RepID=A0A0L0S1R7_ALLM3|nr:hypothetical protein AMAG_02309 [Allomyces macrogynus ATCC 38327]|eukprot:KNE56507.1 hypothetical protein AMAG_02309 [Allomyces macrogynus ATCC 38327]